jgi:hypothetical protein
MGTARPGAYRGPVATDCKLDEQALQILQPGGAEIGARFSLSKISPMRPSTLPRAARVSCNPTLRRS